VCEKFRNEFPLLIKLHPSDEIAKQRHNSFGKNEMWYLMQADENAELIVGFDTDLD
jgi:mannose-6-phosphate isomerase